MHFSLVQLLLLIAVRFTQGVSKNFERKPGPCTFGTHSDSAQYKCADNGYFEVRQCLRDYCVCVDPRSGHEAPATRTTSSKVEPRCGKCHLEMARLLASNSPKQLQCEPNTGHFQPKQCQSGQSCVCVNRETGEPISGANARVETRSNADLACGISASIDSRPISTSSAAKSAASQRPPASSARMDANHPPPPPPTASSATTTDASSSLADDFPPVGNAACRLPKDAGRLCGDGRTPASVQWYFDVESFECLAFRHNGCGGNENHFYSVSDCWRQCKLADFGSCAGLKTPAKDAKGENIVCYSHNGGDDAAKCPPNYRCTMLAFFGVCCHEETQELYKRNYLPSCADRRQTPKRIESGGVPMTLIGKSCEDDFCPRNTTCHKKEIFAHCCQ